MTSPTSKDIATPAGLARAHVHLPAGDDEPRAALVLGHGAGGSVAAPDLTAVTKAALEAGYAVALVEQPYRVAEKRSAAAAPRLDIAWTAVLEDLRGAELRGLEVVTGGRSSGARVACRTAEATGAAGVVCLAFPLHPPQRDPAAERKTRLPELEAVPVPVLVVQGVNDRFGIPPGDPPRRTVVEVEGDHALRKGVAAIGATVAGWLLAQELGAPAPGGGAGRPSA